jgi:signal transduction histidine kinase
MEGPMRTNRLVLRWLRVAGTITWTVIAATFLFVLEDVPEVLGERQWILWATLVGFLALFWVDTDPEERVAARWRLASLVLQSVCALGIAWLPRKPVGFIFLTLVAAQMASLVPAWIAAAWVVLQSLAMGWIYAQIVPAWEAQAYIAVYLGFQAFAHIVVRAALSEAKAREDLARAHAELRAKEALLVESQRLAERARIGRDLHDVLGHHLAAMSLNLEAASHLSEGDARASVERARDLARKLLDDVREVVTELKSEHGYDLEQALTRLASELPRPRIHLDVAADVRVVPDAALAEALIRCAQELMTNAARHSGAEHLWIRLRRGPGGIELSARDDGRGTARADLLGLGLGLAGLEQRFRALGGRLEVASQPGQGFAVTAWLP